MHDYVVNELPQLIEAAGMGVDAVARRSIFGHSMVSRQTDLETAVKEL
jgi:S-formylglutathione hydrolase FrmB